MTFFVLLLKNLKSTDKNILPPDIGMDRADISILPGITKRRILTRFFSTGRSTTTCIP